MSISEKVKANWKMSLSAGAYAFGGAASILGACLLTSSLAKLRSRGDVRDEFAIGMSAQVILAELVCLCVFLWLLRSLWDSVTLTVREGRGDRRETKKWDPTFETMKAWPIAISLSGWLILLAGVISVADVVPLIGILRDYWVQGDVSEACANAAVLAFGAAAIIYLVAFVEALRRWSDHFLAHMRDYGLGDIAMTAVMGVTAAATLQWIAHTGV